MIDFNRDNIEKELTKIRMDLDFKKKHLKAEEVLKEVAKKYDIIDKVIGDEYGLEKDIEMIATIINMCDDRAYAKIYNSGMNILSITIFRPSILDENAMDLKQYPLLTSLNIMLINIFSFVFDVERNIAGNWIEEFVNKNYD